MHRELEQGTGSASCYWEPRNDLAKALPKEISTFQEGAEAVLCGFVATQSAEVPGGQLEMSFAMSFW